jgi:hypothetical protein
MPVKQLVVAVGGLLIIGLTAGAVAYYQQNQNLGTPGVRFREVPGRVAVEVILPETLPGFRAEDLPITEEELNMLPKDTSFGRRRFMAPDGLAFDISVVVMGGDQSSIHRPQSCIPAQGWTIVQEDTDALVVGDPVAYELPFNRLANRKTLLQNGEQVQAESFYLYWFTADGKITASREERILSTAWRLLTAGEVERWAYVAVYVVFPAGMGEAVYPRAREFLALAVPHFQQPPANLEAARRSPVSTLSQH